MQIRKTFLLVGVLAWGIGADLAVQGRSSEDGAFSRVKIDLSAQRAYFYRGDKVVSSSVVSTGREGHRTPKGNFRVVQKDRHHRSTIYGDYVSPSGKVVKRDVDVRKDRRPPGARFRGAPMPYFVRFAHGIGMHAGNVPGYPASHGCIRLPHGAAQQAFNNVSIGTPVSVVR